MPTITIDSIDYEAYADESDADEYLAASIHSANWDSATDATKQKALVTMTRILDRQDWLGDKNDDAQVLEWPRANTGVDDVEDDTIPDDITNACIEGALALVDGEEFQKEQNTSQKLQTIRAGSVSLTYFRGAEGRAIRFPVIIQELVRKYLAGNVPTVTGVATGTDGDSVTENDFGFSEAR